MANSEDPSVRANKGDLVFFAKGHMDPAFETAAFAMKTRGEITVKEIEGSTGANRNTIKVHVKNLAEQHYLRQVGQGRGARYMIK